MKRAQQKRQEKIVIIAAVSIIGLSIATTLYFSGFLLEQFSGGGDSGYRNVTFTDAVLTCKEQSRSSSKAALEQVTLDDHSSRLDTQSNRYLIFFKAVMADGDSANEFYINCYVSAESGRITYYEGMQQKTSPTEVLRRNDGGLFGWPHD